MRTFNVTYRVSGHTYTTKVYSMDRTGVERIFLDDIPADLWSLIYIVDVTEVF